MAVLSTVTKGLIQELENLEVRGRVGTIQISIIKIDQNIDDSPGDLLSLELQWETIG